MWARLALGLLKEIQATMRMVRAIWDSFGVVRYGAETGALRNPGMHQPLADAISEAVELILQKEDRCDCLACLHVNSERHISINVKITIFLEECSRCKSVPAHRCCNTVFTIIELAEKYWLDIERHTVTLCKFIFVKSNLIVSELCENIAVHLMHFNSTSRACVGG